MEDRMISEAAIQFYMQRGRRLRAQQFAALSRAAVGGLAQSLRGAFALPFKVWLLRRKVGPTGLAIGPVRKLGSCSAH